MLLLPYESKKKEKQNTDCLLIKCKAEYSRLCM